MIVSAILAASIVIATPKSKDVFSPDQERRILAQYAGCVVKNMPWTATRLVLERRIDDLADKLRIPNCMPTRSGVQLTLPGQLLRYALAEALIRADQTIRFTDVKTVPALDHGTIEQELKATSSPWNRPWEAKHLAERRAAAALTIAISRLGECVVRTAPTLSGELLRTDVASDAERTAMRELKPAFSSCVDKGATIVFSPDVVRGLVAVSYFRLARASQVASAGAPK